MLTVYHNNRCGKSRECLAFLDKADIAYEVVEYLKTPFKFRELESLVKKLGLRPIDIVRTNEKEWAKFKNENLSEGEILKTIVEFPILMQRPIVVNGDKAVIARPAEAVNSIL